MIEHWNVGIGRRQYSIIPIVSKANYVSVLNAKVISFTTGRSLISDVKSEGKCHSYVKDIVET